MVQKRSIHVQQVLAHHVGKLRRYVLLFGDVRQERLEQLLLARLLAIAAGSSYCRSTALFLP